MEDYFNTLLISEDQIKSDSTLDVNLSGKYLLPSIQMVQDVQLQETIGTGLYRAIQQKVYDNTIGNSDNTQYKYILDVFIQPMLQQYILADLTLQLAGKISNAGVVQDSASNTYKEYSSVSANERASMRQNYLYYADNYKMMLQKYLLHNHNKFVELDEEECYEIHHHLNSAADTGLWLGGGRGKIIF